MRLQSIVFKLPEYLRLQFPSGSFSTTLALIWHKSCGPLPASQAPQAAPGASTPKSAQRANGAEFRSL